MRLVIHLGPKKTGTTALQKYLYQNRKELSTQFKVCYPTPLSGNEAHHELFYGINFQLNGTAPYADAQGITKIRHPHEVLQEYLAQARELDCHTVIISSETLFEINEKQSKLLQKCTEGFEEIEYVFGLRDRIGLIVSRWQEEVKHGYTKSLSEYIEPNSALGPNAADYYQKMLDLPARGETNNLKVKPFLYSGLDGKQNLFSEFLSCLRVPHSSMNLNSEKINESVKLGPLIALMTANNWIQGHNSLVTINHQKAWLQPISRALDLRDYVFENTNLEEVNYPILSLLVHGVDKLASFRKLNELVNLSLRDFQLAFPDEDHGRYEKKLRNEIEENLNRSFEINHHDFHSFLEEYRSIGVKLADEFLLSREVGN